MAKASHPSLSHFLIGFLLVLVVADTTYVHGACNVGLRVQVKRCAVVNCDSLCRFNSGFPVDHTECELGAFSQSNCLCCRKPAV
ncbi:hypothetical protein MKW94_019682 [Papaver nudicaule]|uniref:Uncharacterized protein n=1 Tax=Papaver nudicaule TaxID=74823 RepID=A0AA42AUI6_PAPNU|nr:hypothetical protein [Papaver nudicaule]